MYIQCHESIFKGNINNFTIEAMDRIIGDKSPIHHVTVHPILLVYHGSEESYTFNQRDCINEKHAQLTYKTVIVLNYDVMDVYM